MTVDYNSGNRKYVIIGIMTVVILIYLIRLFTLQVLDNDYKQFADSNAFLKKIQYPSRGLIYDRNGKLLVYNQPAYDVMMIVREIQEFDTLDFCRTLGITREQFDRRWAMVKDRRLNPGYSGLYPSDIYLPTISTRLWPFARKIVQIPRFFYSKPYPQRVCRK